MGKRRRFSKRFNEDWNFYVANADKFCFCGERLEQFACDLDGLSAKHCFHTLDSTGKLKPCKEPELLYMVVVCKKSVNLHINMWVHGYDDVCIGIQELLEEFIEPPTWVETALRMQLCKHNSGSNRRNR